MHGGDFNMADILAELKRLGWVVTTTKRGHFRCVPPDKSRPVVHVSSAQCAGTRGGAALRNVIQDLRRGGLVWPPKRLRHG